MRLGAIAKTISRGAPLVVLAAILVIAQTGSHQGKPNIASWWERTGYPVPAILLSPQIDMQATIACALFLLAWVAVLLLLHRERRPRRSPDYLTPFEALDYLAHRTRWGWRKRWELSPGRIQGKAVRLRVNVLMLAPIEFEREASRVGTRVRAWGSREGSAETELIRPEFWISNGLDYDACFHPESVSRTEPKVSFAGNVPLRYERLLIDRAGVVRTWRKMNFIQRMIVSSELRRRRPSHGTA